MRKYRFEDKTVFSIESHSNGRYVHFLGYCYYVGYGEKHEYRQLEYVGHYVKLDEVIRKGVYNCEMTDKYVKQGIGECSYDYMVRYYNNDDYKLCSELSENIGDGIYIWNNEYNEKNKMQ